MDATKRLVTRLIDEVINEGRLELLEDVCSPVFAQAARGWITPFRGSFPDVHMTIVDIIAEGEKVAARLTCSGTNLGDWQGHPPTGRRFEGVDEVYIFRVEDGRIVDAWGLEDTRARMTQLGLT